MSRSSRKLDHLNLAIETYAKAFQGFENVHFVHQALPEASFEETTITTSIGGLSLSSPIIINAITGGAHETTKINRDLALVAKETGLAMAVGSQMSAIKNKEYVSSYKIVREVNPDGIIIGNLGMEATVEQAKEAIEMLGADALQIHLNVIQELIMPEGDRDFRGTLERIKEIKEAISIPLIIKEVGFGISREVAVSLLANGITIVDVGGKGGTSFARIENSRRDTPINIFDSWGIDTATSILEVKSVAGIDVIGSGGIQSSLDIAKAIVLGASAVGIAGTFLKSLNEDGVDGTIKLIDDLHYQLKLLMTGLGTKTIADLQDSPRVITGHLKDWCLQRNISLK